VLAETRVQASEQKRVAAMKFQMLSTTRAMLKEFHRNLNQKLSDILDDAKFLWAELAVDSNAGNVNAESDQSDHVSRK